MVKLINAEQFCQFGIARYVGKEAKDKHTFTSSIVGLSIGLGLGGGGHSVNRVIAVTCIMEKLDY